MHEKCGVTAAVDLTGRRNVLPVLAGLTKGVQHRGQLGSGVGLFQQHEHDTIIRILKDNKQVGELLTPNLESPEFFSTSGIGHTRYATSGSRDAALAQPFHHRNGSPDTQFAFGFNGNLANYPDLEARLRQEGMNPEFDVDTEALRQMFIQGMSGDTRESMSAVFRRLQETIDGACNLVYLDGKGDVYAYRDKHGFRPLAYAQHDDFAVVASENCAIHGVWKEAETKSVPPGHMLHISREMRNMTLE